MAKMDSPITVTRTSAIFVNLAWKRCAVVLMEESLQRADSTSLVYITPESRPSSVRSIRAYNALVTIPWD